MTKAEKDAWVLVNARKSQFIAQATVESKDNVSVEIFFKKGPGSLQSVFGFGQKILEPTDENCSRSGSGGRLSISIVANEKKNSASNSSC